MNAVFYSLTTEIGRGLFNAFARANRDNAWVSSDLIAVLLFVAIGLLLTAAFFIFFILGLTTQIGQIVAVST